MKKKLVLLVLIVAAVAGAILAIRHKREQVAARPAAGIPPVVLETRRLSPAPTVLTRPVSAEVSPLRDAVLASRFSAYVLELPRYEGERVKKGEVLIRLDVSQAEADLARAEAQLAQTRMQEGSLAADLAAARALAQSEADRAGRLESLEKIGGAALEQVQAAQAARAAAQARLAAAQSNSDNYRALLRASEAQARAARENLGYAVIRAPFDGVVTQRLAQAGDLAAPGKPLVKLMDTGAGVRLLVSVPQALKPLALQVNGQRLALRPWPEAVGQGMARYEARARGDWLPGARVDARLEVFRADSALVAPRDCLLASEGGKARLVRLGVDDNRGKAGAVDVEIAAEGDEGVALADAGLAGAHLACASPDILARALAGAPVQTRETRETRAAPVAVAVGRANSPHPRPLSPGERGE